MITANFEFEGTPHITVTCHNDLVVTGTPERRVRVDIDDDSDDESPASRVDRRNDHIDVTALDDCIITCPAESVLHIEHVSGDLRVTQLSGPLTIRTVNGDAVLHEIGALQLDTVQGDLSLRGAQGDVRIETVRGDVKLKRLTGNVNLARVAGDLLAHSLDGSANFGSVGGDVLLELVFQPGQTYTATANGDIELRVAGGGATLALNCRGDLRTRLPLTGWVGDERSGTGVVGDGSAQVTLSAKGDLLVLPAQPSRFDPGAFSDQVESMIDAAMSQFEAQMSRVQQSLEARWGQTAQAERAAERARRSAERTKRRAERAAGTWTAAFTPPFRPPAPPTEPVSDEERLLVLKMVQDGKLSVDEAAKLLAAMEG